MISYSGGAILVFLMNPKNVFYIEHIMHNTNIFLQILKKGMGPLLFIGARMSQVNRSHKV